MDGRTITKKNKVLIAPSLLAADFSRLGDAIRSIDHEADALHLDIMDGHFVPNLSFGLPVVQSIRKTTNLPFDVHLMIDKPARFVDHFIDAGADWITFHVEAVDDPASLCQAIRKRGARCGLSIHPDTDERRLFPFLSEVDLVLLMSVYPGFGGQRYLDEATRRIRHIRDAIDRAHADALLSVDGGVDTVTAPMIVSAGATLLVAGNAIFSKDDPAQAIRELRACVAL